ncbi:NmrA family NAD(P)-binding protein [Fibrella sp. HMF5335]|uniref:NmrA family NAD(P)-binding protein n=1 Tax=Fibrella rubiginis TaxID=2817060 RepID=A0A939GHF8_9BACT|nr:NmrA family NAD(P)-binding protein [Fibrella rubiginis]MBO0936542.1 NmrA family NAD(P)-binding protein [Fibrella rubiginis]
MKNAIVVVGATGNLGGRIVTALLDKGADVRAVVRPSSDKARVDELKQKGVTIIQSEMTDARELAPSFADVAVVVSAVQGLHDVIVGTQTVVLDAAVAAGVPRFIPSDFASDFTKLKAGENRNFDLRREFSAYLDKAPIQATSILNGAFAELLTYGTPLLNTKEHQVGYWEDADWRIDFTTMDDTAAYTAAAAMDATTPRFLRTASFQISPNELATVAGEALGTPFTVVRLGSRADLLAYFQRERAAHPEGEEQLYASWQQSQYIYSMFNVQNDPLDNARYPELTWTTARDVLAPRGK